MAMFLTFAVFESVLTITKTLLTTHNREVERKSNKISHHQIISFSYWSSSSIDVISMIKWIVIRERGMVIVLNGIEFGKEGYETINRQVFAGVMVLQCEKGKIARFYVVFEVDIAIAILYSLFKYLCIDGTITDTSISIFLNFSTITRYILFAIAVLLWMSPVIIGKTLHGPLTIVQNIDKNSNSIDGTSINDNENNVGTFTCKEFWLLYTIPTLMAGAGSKTFNTISQLVESMAINKYDYNINSDGNDSKFNANLRDAIVYAISIGNFSGRLISRFISDYFANNRKKN